MITGEFLEEVGIQGESRSDDFRCLIWGILCVPGVIEQGGGPVTFPRSACPMGRRGTGFPMLECKQHITTNLHILYIKIGQKLKTIPSVFYVRAVSSILLE